MSDKNDIFVKHIEKHLEAYPGAKVICKICGRSIDQIYAEENDSCSRNEK
jgi:translation initiation factor 2 beta subunit (eIF-2beta)/eIF-5